MAIIKCPECGKDISDRAKSCIHCGCPLEELALEGTVRVKMPSNIAVGAVGLFSSRDAIITNTSGQILWKGLHGENARFVISQPTKIVINLGGWANEVEGFVEPRRKYALVQDLGMHWLATFRLTEVDVIDSD